jgi:hypothetical protein
VARYRRARADSAAEQARSSSRMWTPPRRSAARNDKTR